MATYFNKYYFEFDDIHITSPIRWRVDIMDSQGNTPTEPYLLTAAAQPLITERLDTSDDKFTTIIGRQITASYIYTGDPNEPLPEEFFEADERRYRIEVRKNGVLDGVYYIKPDFSQYPDVHAPFVVQLKAIDGLGYTKGTDFNSYDDTGLLYYQKVPLYEALVTRALNLIFDEGTPVNVLQSLVPNGASPGDHLLFDSYVHLDIFYDFVEGPKSVYDVLYAFCKSFNARIITDQNQIWFIRLQDVNYDSYTIDQYLSDSVVNTLTLSDFVRTAGPNPSFDSIPTNLAGQNITLPAVKKAEFEVEYKAINILKNFDWRGWDGSDFEDWGNLGLSVDRSGTGTIDDPYQAFIEYNTDVNDWLIQITDDVDYPRFSVGDTMELELRHLYNNTRVFSISINIFSTDVVNSLHALQSDGNWQPITVLGDPAYRIPISRSGKRVDGSFKLKSVPIPGRAGTNIYANVIIHPPNELSDVPDNPDTNGVFIYPIKLGVIAFSSKGRHITITNNANFSQVKEVEKFTFIDTGEDGLSNTIFTGPSQTPEDGGWESPKPGVNPGDIERHMAIGVIDQYQRSVNSWQGQLYSNSLAFYNPIKLTHKPDKLFVQCADRYDNRNCLHDVTLVEVFKEGTAGYDILEYDIEDTE